MSDPTVATIIKAQVGVMALAEVGARGFLHDDTSLYFDAKPKSRIVRVKIWLTPSDTYTVQVFNKKTGVVLYELEGVYNDMLASIIRNLSKEL